MRKFEPNSMMVRQIEFYLPFAVLKLSVRVALYLAVSVFTVPRYFKPKQPTINIGVLDRPPVYHLSFASNVNIPPRFRLVLQFTINEFVNS